jgi:hypothetical protein
MGNKSELAEMLELLEAEDRAFEAEEFRKEEEALVIHEVPGLAAPRVAAIAEIPHEQRGAFCVEAAKLISRAQSRAIIQAWVRASPGAEKKFEEIETAVSALRSALRKLTDEERCYFYVQLRSTFHQLGAGEPTPIGDFLPKLKVNEIARALREAPVTMRVLSALAVASAEMTNRNPNRRGKKENWQNAAFQAFVGALWRCADKHGGTLSANCKNNVGSGAMFKALEELRPYFDESRYTAGFIKKVLPAQTIANIVAAQRKRGTLSKGT